MVGGGTLDAVTGGTLPYLLKLLAAAQPLSIQVHPTLAQAKEGWERESGLALDDPQRNYRDANHKPELLVALSERFESLSGLRPVAQTLQLIDALAPTAAVGALRERLSAEGDVLRDTLSGCSTGRRARPSTASSTRSSPPPAGTREWSDTLRAIARIADTYPGDPGSWSRC